MKTIKTYVLDTSVLIHNPNSLEAFEDNQVRIPIEVIHEIDKLKTEPNERGRSARSVQRKLLAIFGTNDLTKPAKTSGGGNIAVVLGEIPSTKDKNEDKLIQGLGKIDQNDHFIIATAYRLKKTKKDQIILVSKDMGMILKARAIGLEAEDYKHDKPEVIPNGTDMVLPVKQNEIQAFASCGEILLPALAQKQKTKINQYLILGEKGIPARHKGEGKFVKLFGQKGIDIPQGTHIRPLNLGQEYLLDALLNPSIALVTVRGPAGTGKTLLSLAAALMLKSQKAFNQILITKPIISMGKDIGALPGTLEEKMKPWLQPYSDALDFLFRTNHNGNGPQQKPQSPRKNKPIQKGGWQNQPRVPHFQKPYDQMIEDGSLQIEALSFIRGRSIPNAFFILDETQNLTPAEIKTVLTRIGKGSKIILLGDEDQIDNPYLDRLSNGLTYVRTRMDNIKQAAHIHLTKGERSEIANLAAQKL